MTNRRGRERDFAILTKRRLAVLAWVGLLVVFGFRIGWAQLPETINYQGRLSHAGGALVNGTLAMSFAIYNDKNAATPLWTEAYAAVQVTNGQFSVDLGSVTPLTSLTFDEKYWLGITVGADPEMNPRKPFTSVGYAVRALHAQNADHSNNSDHAVDADDSTHAVDADDSTHADNADYATTAGYASTADAANSAVFATSAGAAATATSATNASHATTADTATSAGTADSATHATSADTATNATNAVHATSADTATNAANATIADVSEFARGVREQRVAIVATGFRGPGAPPAGGGFYAEPYTAMTDLPNWCPSPDESSPCLLKLMPGVYDIGTSVLATQPWVAIEGSGVDVTIIRLESALQPAPNAEVRSLTLEFTADPGGPLVDIQNGDVRISHVSIEADVGGAPDVVKILGMGPDPLEGIALRDVTISLAEGVGLRNERANTTFSDLAIRSQGAGGSPWTGLFISDSSPLVSGLSIQFTAPSGVQFVGIRNQGNSDPAMTDTKIQAAFTGGGGGSLTGIWNQDSSPDLTDVVIQLQGHDGSNVIGMLNDGGSEPTLQDVTIGLDFLGSACGTEGTIGIQVQSGSVSLSDSTIRSEGGGCSLSFGLLVDGADVTMTGATINAGGSNAKGIECQSSTVEMTGSSVRSTGTHGIWTQDDCRFRIDHSVVAGTLDAIRDLSTATATGYYLMGASKFIGNINEGPGHATFECTASYEESGNSLNELGPDCR